MENTKKPLANKIIIQPRYLDKKVCKFKKKTSETDEFNETTVVIKIIEATAVKNRDLLILFIFEV
tara:strand:+ start:620 stop:814 length:195 start_codon:yes stop_codon:yes gene_type:complete